MASYIQPPACGLSIAVRETQQVLAERSPRKQYAWRPQPDMYVRAYGSICLITMAELLNSLMDPLERTGFSLYSKSDPCKMITEQIEELIVLLKDSGIVFEEGLSFREIENVESAFDI